MRGRVKYREEGHQSNEEDAARRCNKLLGSAGWRSPLSNFHCAPPSMEMLRISITPPLKVHIVFHRTQPSNNHRLDDKTRAEKTPENWIRAGSRCHLGRAKKGTLSAQPRNHGYPVLTQTYRIRRRRTPSVDNTALSPAQRSGSAKPTSLEPRPCLPSPEDSHESPAPPSPSCAAPRAPPLMPSSLASRPPTTPAQSSTSASKCPSAENC